MTLLLGLLAGILTTVVGMGGGVMLVLVLTIWWGDPLAALAIGTPALLVGNAHRFAMYRRAVSWRIAGPFVAGALPGSILGGLLAVRVPTIVLHVVLVLAAIAAAARSVGWWTPRPTGRALVPAGAGIGALSATAGAGGFMAGPILLAAGLTGPSYIATSSISALAMHVGRMFAYGIGGLFEAELVRASVGLAVAIPVGNVVGARLRTRIPEDWSARLETAAAVAMVVLAVTGLVG